MQEGLLYFHVYQRGSYRLNFYHRFKYRHYFFLVAFLTDFFRIKESSRSSSAISIFLPFGFSGCFFSNFHLCLSYIIT